MCGPHVAAPVSAADNGTSPAVSSASAADGQERERKPLWLHYLNGQRHFLKVSNMQRSDNRACRRCTVCVCVCGQCQVCGVEGGGGEMGLGWGGGGGDSDEVSHYLAVKISTTLSEQKQCVKTAKTPALSFTGSLHPAAVTYHTFSTAAPKHYDKEKEKENHTGTYQLFCDRINACLLKVIECVYFETSHKIDTLYVCFFGVYIYIHKKIHLRLITESS